MPSTSFADMPTLASASPTPSPPFHRRRKSWARKIERCCCSTFAHFPLVFVYGLSSWAVWVEVGVSLAGDHDAFAYLRAGLGVALYALANVSYTIAVFTDPGSPLDPRRDASRTGRRKGGGYKGLPSYEDGPDLPDGPIPREWNMSTVTAKSSGKPRYCKKCRSVKPDRTHHCSTCGKCVLKMDHHCPWLATCVGLRNYKAFLLFVIYTSLFCWLDFAVSGWWTWQELVDGKQMQEGLTVVNTILLAVLGGIIGLVLSGFTGWHMYLVVTGQTTIESLEKTTYLSPLKKSMEQQFRNGRTYLGQEMDGTADPKSKEDQPLGERLKEIHANALPGVLRPEEGESRTPSRSHTPVPPEGTAFASPAQDSLHRSYASLEAQRERDRYNRYLDEQDSAKLPNAFDMGWKRNLLHVFGDNPFLWFVPILNTSGDGWQWDVSPKWTESREQLTRERQQREREDAYWGQQQAQRSFQPPPRDLRWTPGQGFVDNAPNASPYGAGRRSQNPVMHMDGSTTIQMQPLDRRKSDADAYDTSSDEEGQGQAPRHGLTGNEPTANWNDVPDDFLTPDNRRGARSRSRGRTKGD